MVSQALLYAAHVLPVGIVWLVCVTGFLPLMEYGPDCDCFRHLVLYAPIYAVLLLGKIIKQLRKTDSILVPKTSRMVYISYGNPTSTDDPSLVYALASVVHGVLTFSDCPDAKEELVREIKEAREDLKKRKIM